MYIKIIVNARAKREEFLKMKEYQFKISVKEPAVHNLANERVREIIASHFKVSLGKVRIINGHHSPSKLLVVDTD